MQQTSSCKSYFASTPAVLHMIVNFIVLIVILIQFITKYDTIVKLIILFTHASSDRA